MKYAIISDIHGNLIAFQAVLKDICSKNIDKILLLGDYCMDLPWPNETVNLLKNLVNAYVIRGNKEDYFKNIENQNQKFWNSNQLAPIYWNYKELTANSRTYLKNLPETITISDFHNEIYLAHMPEMFFGKTFPEPLTVSCYLPVTSGNSEAFHNQYLKYVCQILKNDTLFINKLKELPDGVYLFGHYHMQWYAEINNKLIINPGSCGLPMDNDTRASYTILDYNEPNCDAPQSLVEERRVPYDIELTIEALKKSGLYKEAEIWSRINIMQLKSGKQYINSFLQDVEETANLMREKKRPYPNYLWKSAAEKWFMKHQKDLE